MSPYQAVVAVQELVDLAELVAVAVDLKGRNAHGSLLHNEIETANSKTPPGCNHRCHSPGSSTGPH